MVLYKCSVMPNFILCTHIKPSHFLLYATGCESENESDFSGFTTVIVVGVVCSLTFLTIGVLLGAVGVYLTLRVRGRLSATSHTSPSPTPSTIVYEQVPEVMSSQSIQLKSNDAYCPVQSQIQTTENAAYGQVQL